MIKEKLNVDFSRQNVVSYSQYSNYKQCQYRWYLAYVKKHKVNTDSINTIFGSSIHETIQYYLKVMYEKSVVEANKIDLNAYFKQSFIQNYKDCLESSGHVSTKEEFTEYYNDGLSIVDYIKAKRGKYFSKRNVKLKGIELSLLEPVLDSNPSVLLTGYLDLVFIYEDGTHEIWDIKTSGWGWKDKDKKDPLKINQILIYKRFYSKKYNIPEDKIDVKFFIVKRKVYENSEFPISRVQEFIPANGKKKVNDAVEDFKKFVEDSFIENGKYNTNREYEKNTSACTYCPYLTRKDLCDR